MIRLNKLPRSKETIEKWRIAALRRGCRPPSAKGKKWSKEHIQKIVDSRIRWFNNTNGTHRKTPVRNQIRAHPKYHIWRMSVFYRDKFTCVICGKANRTIQADHFPRSLAGLVELYEIKTIQQAIECRALWRKDNGRTLCFECHKKTPTFLNRWHVRPIARMQMEFGIVN